jgi:hypothetical protein
MLLSAWRNWSKPLVVARRSQVAVQLGGMVVARGNRLRNSGAVAGAIVSRSPAGPVAISAEHIPTSELVDRPLGAAADLVGENVEFGDVIEWFVRGGCLRDLPGASEPNGGSMNEVNGQICEARTEYARPDQALHTVGRWAGCPSEVFLEDVHDPRVEVDRFRTSPRSSGSQSCFRIAAVDQDAVGAQVRGRAEVGGGWCRAIKDATDANSWDRGLSNALCAGESSCRAVALELGGDDLEIHKGRQWVLAAPQRRHATPYQFMRIFDSGDCRPYRGHLKASRRVTSNPARQSSKGRHARRWQYAGKGALPLRLGAVEADEQVSGTASREWPAVFAARFWAYRESSVRGGIAGSVRRMPIMRHREDGSSRRKHLSGWRHTRPTTSGVTAIPEYPRTCGSSAYAAHTGKNLWEMRHVGTRSSQRRSRQVVTAGQDGRSALR